MKIKLALSFITRYKQYEIYIKKASDLIIRVSFPIIILEHIKLKYT